MRYGPNQAVWLKLPETIRAGIPAMVEAAWPKRKDAR